MALEPAALLIGYLFGSIPSSYIAARFKKGIDIRSTDTGNVGAGSVFRVVGVRDGILVLLADMGKGAAAVFAAQALGVSQAWVLGAGVAAIVGHTFPLFINFRGGQGVATIIGIFLALTPRSMGVTLALIGIILLLNRRVVLHRFFFAVACAAPALPLCIWLIESSATLTFYSLGIILVVMVRNRRRLRSPKTASMASLEAAPMESARPEVGPTHADDGPVETAWR